MVDSSIDRDKTTGITENSGLEEDFKDDDDDDEEMEPRIKLEDSKTLYSKLPGAKMPSIKTEKANKEFKNLRMNALLSLKNLPLGFLRIGKIENLDIFDKLEVLSIQYNKIEKIENLENLKQLEYLNLKGNLIKEVQNLRHFKVLSYLDLGENKIESLKVEELPKSLETLSFLGNKVTQSANYKPNIFTHLEELQELDEVEYDEVEKFRIMGIFPMDENELENGENEKEQMENLEVNENGIKEKNFDEILDEEDGALITELRKTTEELLEKTRAKTFEKIEAYKKDLIEYDQVQKQIRDLLYENSKFSKRLKETH